MVILMIHVATETLLTIDQAAKKLHVSKATVTTWIKRGTHGMRLEAIKFGVHWRTSEEAIQRFGDRQTPAFDIDLNRTLPKAPFREVAKHGAIALGGAVLTSAGKLPFKAIIHVAGINMLWRASERSIRDSVRNAIQVAQENGFQSIAFRLIGAGSGGFNQDQSKALMLDELSKIEVPMLVKIVVFKKAKT